MSASQSFASPASAGRVRRPRASALATAALTLVVGAAVGLGLATAPSATAAVNLTLGSAAAGPGENAVLDVAIQADGGPVALQFDLRFDAARWTPGPAVAGPALTGGYSVQSANPAPGVARVLIYSASNRTFGNGTIARLSMRALAGAPEGATPASISNVVVSSATGVLLEPVRASGGTLTLRNESAPRFRPPVLAANGQITLSVEGQDGRSYTLQASTDPSTGWQDAATAVASGGVAVFVDTPVVGGARFYRAILVP
ncbi:MAG: cohesin domain-containing protein [Limisphaerales bacterium]